MTPEEIEAFGHQVATMLTQQFANVDVVFMLGIGKAVWSSTMGIRSVESNVFVSTNLTDIVAQQSFLDEMKSTLAEPDTHVTKTVSTEEQ
jgi:hypothetical protein